MQTLVGIHAGRHAGKPGPFAGEQGIARSLSPGLTEEPMRSLLSLFVAVVVGSSLVAADPLVWPAVTNEMKPWTRWWWLGSAVTPAEITRSLQEFKAAGLGGVEICPIYGAK